MKSTPRGNSLRNLPGSGMQGSRETKTSAKYSTTLRNWRSTSKLSGIGNPRKFRSKGNGRIVSTHRRRKFSKNNYMSCRKGKGKNLFEIRQNELLGVQNKSTGEFDMGKSSLSGSKMQEINLRKQQQEVYGRGLESQVSLNEQRRRKVIENHFNPGSGYNPITNPIPVVYKNPNVLRMLTQK